MNAPDQPYDSTQDTKDHIKRVQELLGQCSYVLHCRGQVHDKSKLEEPEKSGFDACVPKLKNLTYGSDEYRAALREIKPTLEHHYKHNSHHPEYYGPYAIDASHPLSLIEDRLKFPASQNDQSTAEQAMAGFIARLKKAEESNVQGMNLFDVLEMLMDWKAATERMSNGDIRKSLAINIDRFGLSTQLASILKNTIEYMQW